MDGVDGQAIFGMTSGGMHPQIKRAGGLTKELLCNRCESDVWAGLRPKNCGRELGVNNKMTSSSSSH
jgi:hypothetical protein